MKSFPRDQDHRQPAVGRFGLAASMMLLTLRRMEVFAQGGKVKTPGPQDVHQLSMLLTLLATAGAGARAAGQDFPEMRSLIPAGYERRMQDIASAREVHEFLPHLLPTGVRYEHFVPCTVIILLKLIDNPYLELLDPPEQQYLLTTVRDFLEHLKRGQDWIVEDPSYKTLL